MTEVKGKESIMKLLLSSNSNPPLDRAYKGLTRTEGDEEEPFRLSSYLHKSSGYCAVTNQEENPFDHSYVRAPNWRPELVFVKPLRTLFVHPSNDIPTREEDGTVDVESDSMLLEPVYDVGKATTLMEECEKHVGLQHPDEGSPEWEEHVPRINWTTLQSRLFNRVARLLHNDRLARLAWQGHINEPVLRRVSVDQTARRLRQTLASVTWHPKYTQWLHNTLMDHLPSPYLVSYLEALQTLKAKVPMLVERMLAGTTTRGSLATPNHELVSIVHKRPWDPLAGGIARHKPRKLPQDPILVMVPSGPGAGTTSHSRTHHWMANLSSLGTVVCVYSSPGRVVGKVSVANCLDHMLCSTRAKVAELHADYEDKPIVLVGIGSGATLACQVALVENVAAVICLGFPMYTVEDNRGTPDDSLLNLPVPTLFVVGQNAATCCVDDLEEMREKLNVVTSLLVVGGADDQLRLSKAKKKLDGVTQTMVDKCILDEVGDFVGTLLSPGYVPPTRPIVTHPVEPPPKRPIVRTVERKRKVDITVPTNAETIAIGPTPPKKGRKPKMAMVQKVVRNKWGTQSQPSATDAQQANSSASTPAISTPVVVATASVVKQGQVHRPVPESTITVVAASSPTLSAASTVKSRLSGGSGQLTSLSSILQPGTRGVLSPTSRTVSTDEQLPTDNPLALTDELNILDMPVILGDQAPDEALPLSPVPALPPSPSPVKFILTNARGRPKPGVSAIKYIKPNQHPVKCTKIYISKAETSNRNTVLVGSLNEPSQSRPQPKIRHIPATKHTQFY